MEKQSGKCVLVTGATGTLGYNIARQLAADSRHTTVLPVRSTPTYLLDLGTHLHLEMMDLCNREHVRDLLQRAKPEVVIHCAASGLRPAKPSWFDLVSFNVEATLRLFESCCELENCHFIYISSGLVYREQGRPLRESDPMETLHPYGASKAAADLLLQAAAVEFKRGLTILRPFAFTGLRDFRPRLFPSLIHAATDGQYFEMTGGEQIRDFCAAEDVARAVLMCVERSPVNRIETFNLGSGEALSLRELVESICSELELPLSIRYGALARQENDPSHLVADVSAARNVLNWRAKTRLPYSVWELAREMAPQLALRKPMQYLAR